VPEVLVDGVTGFIVDDVDGAVGALENLEQIDRRACRKHFERHFSDERMAAQYLAIYKKLVQKEPTTIALDDGVMSWTDLLPNTTT
jgi:glycosyltransferase involved in cell wall biosynthesis